MRRGGGPSDVLLHVYDLHPANNYAHWAGLGAYHCGGACTCLC